MPIKQGTFGLPMQNEVVGQPVEAVFRPKRRFQGRADFLEAGFFAFPGNAHLGMNGTRSEGVYDEFVKILTLIDPF